MALEATAGYAVRLAKENQQLRAELARKDETIIAQGRRILDLEAQLQPLNHRTHDTGEAYAARLVTWASPAECFGDVNL